LLSEWFSTQAISNYFYCVHGSQLLNVGCQIW